MANPSKVFLPYQPHPNSSSRLIFEDSNLVMVSSSPTSSGFEPEEEENRRYLVTANPSTAQETIRIIRRLENVDDDDEEDEEDCVDGNDVPEGILSDVSTSSSLQNDRKGKFSRLLFPHLVYFGTLLPPIGLLNYKKQGSKVDKLRNNMKSFDQLSILICFIKNI